MILSEMIRAVQKTYGMEPDGLAGPQTWGAIYRDKVLGKATTPGTEAHTAISDISVVDERSERAIQTLLPEVRPYARGLLHLAAEQGVTLIVTSATRTYAEQEELYKQGRTNPGPIVTKAHGGYSNHNFGIAFDVTIFKGGVPVWESPAYKAVGAWGKSLGLTWGGDWASIEDEPHFELHPPWARGMSEADMLAQLRTRHTLTRPIFV